MTAQGDPNAPPVESLVEVYGDDEGRDLGRVVVGALALLVVAAGVAGAAAAGNAAVAATLLAAVALFGAAVATGAIERR